MKPLDDDDYDDAKDGGSATYIEGSLKKVVRDERSQRKAVAVGLKRYASALMVGRDVRYPGTHSIVP